MGRYRASPLLDAIYGADLKALIAAKKAGEHFDQTDSDGRTLLMHAVLEERPSIPIIRFLAENGTDLHAQDRGQRWTALHFAAQSQNPEVVRALLEYEPRVDILDSFGNTPLWRAVMTQNPNLEVVRAFLWAGANPGKKNNHGVSAIDLSNTAGNTELARLLETSQHT